MANDKEKENNSKKDGAWLRKRQAARIVAAIIVVIALLGAIAASCYGLRQFLLIKNPHFICRTLDYQPTPNFTTKRVQTILEEMGEAKGCIMGRSNLLQLDISAIREKLLSYPSVRGVKVRRILPGTLKIELSERIPFAILSAGNVVDALIDSEGYVFPLASLASIPGNLPCITNVKGAKKLPFGEPCNEPAIKAALAFLENTTGDTQIKGAEFTTVAIVLNYELERMECHIKGVPGNKIYSKDTVVFAPFDAELINTAIKKFYHILALKIQNGETLSSVDLTQEVRIPTRD